MSPNQLPPQNTIALATVGMERESERGRERDTQRHKGSKRVIKDRRVRKMEKRLVWGKEIKSRGID